MSEFRFHSITWEWVDWIWPNFAYALILTRSRSELLHANFRKFLTELWPLIDARISFQLSILRTNWWYFAKFCIYIDIDNIWVGIVTRQFSQINNRVMALDIRILFPLNILRTNWWNWPNFGYALILTRSRLRLLHINFRKFLTWLWPLIVVRISFPLNNLRMCWWNLTKFCICVYIDKI